MPDKPDKRRQARLAKTDKTDPALSFLLLAAPPTTPSPPGRGVISVFACVVE